MLRLENMEIEMINPRFVTGFLKECFTKDYLAELTEAKRKDAVKSIFMAAVVRELIVRNENKVEDMVRDRHTFLTRYSSFSQQEGGNTELTWLNRFERALRVLKNLLNPKSNKQTYINVGTNLQGSPTCVVYITGGANRPETERRVQIYERLTDIKPHKRVNKPTECSPPVSSYKPTPIKPPVATMAPIARVASSEEKRKRGRPKKLPEVAIQCIKYESHPRADTDSCADTTDIDSVPFNTEDDFFNDLEFIPMDLTIDNLQE
jgi:hypothetical protein